MTNSKPTHTTADKLRALASRDAKAAFKKFDDWMTGMGLDIGDLNKPYFLPDLRVAYISGMSTNEKAHLAAADVVLQVKYFLGSDFKLSDIYALEKAVMKLDEVLK